RLYNETWGWQVWVAYTEGYHINSFLRQFVLQPLEVRENIGWKSGDTFRVRIHLSSLVGICCLNIRSFTVSRSLMISIFPSCTRTSAALGRELYWLLIL